MHETAPQLGTSKLKQAVERRSFHRSCFTRGSRGGDDEERPALWRRFHKFTKAHPAQKQKEINCDLSFHPPVRGQLASSVDKKYKKKKKKEKKGGDVASPPGPSAATSCKATEIRASMASSGEDLGLHKGRTDRLTEDAEVTGRISTEENYEGRKVVQHMLPKSLLKFGPLFCCVILNYLYL